MESKIAIDIDVSGRPFIRLDFKGSEDLRDKVISRFLTRADAFKHTPDGHLKNPHSLNLHVLWYDKEKDQMQAMIEVPESSPSQI